MEAVQVRKMYQLRLSPPKVTGIIFANSCSHSLVAPQRVPKKAKQLPIGSLSLIRSFLKDITSPTRCSTPAPQTPAARGTRGPHGTVPSNHHRRQREGDRGPHAQFRPIIIAGSEDQASRLPRPHPRTRAAQRTEDFACCSRAEPPPSACVSSLGLPVSVEICIAC